MLRSTVLRLAIGYAVLFAGSALVLAGYIYWTTESYLARQTDKTIVASADGLLERFRSGGVTALARAIEVAGASILNTGIGWHEARVPTIATSVPRAAFAHLTGRLRPLVGIPVITSNRINTPQVGEDLLADGMADMVSMARPLLADSQWAIKAREGRCD